MSTTSTSYPFPAMTPISRDHFASHFAEFMNAEKLDVCKVAGTIGCSAPTLDRLLNGNSLPSDEMLRQVMLLTELKFEKYAGLSESQRSDLGKALTVSGGVVTGVGASVAAVSVSGAVAGFGAAGITSGLAALGGTMLGGLIVVAAIPVVAGGAGYGIYRWVRLSEPSGRLTMRLSIPSGNH